MKKIFSILLALAATIGVTTSCSDVPMPYDINNGSASFGKKLPYKNASLSTFSMYDTKGVAAWSAGSSYTQATGYQKWDGADAKSNKEVESYLISPALCTNCTSGKVRISFDNTIRYENKVTDWQKYHKIYISKDYDGNTVDFDKATWTELAFTPKASTTNDWTLYNSGYIAIPDEFVNHDSVYVAFYFYAPAENSTTWELENFLIEEGEADNNGGGTTTETFVGTKEAPVSVAEAKQKVGSKGYVTGYIVGYVDGQKLEEGAKFEASSAVETELLLADAADCTDATVVLPVQLPTGDIRTKLNPNVAENIGKKVILFGSFENYFGTAGLKSTSWAKIDDTEVGKDPEAEVPPIGEAKGDGTKENPYNVAAIIKFTTALGADKNSDKEVYFEGIICDDPNVDTGQYGNATFKISDDGTDNNTFYIFRAFDLNNAKFTTKNIKKGDKVVICGTVVNYKGNTPETAANKAYLVSINGTTEGGNTTGGDDSGNTGSSTGTSEGVTIDGTTVTLTNSAVTAGTETVTFSINTLEFDSPADVPTIEFGDGTTLTISQGENKNAPKLYALKDSEGNVTSKELRAYAGHILTFNGKSQIAKIVIECNTATNKVTVGDNTATLKFDGNNVEYVPSTTSGVQLRVKTITITYAATASAKIRK